MPELKYVDEAAFRETMKSGKPENTALRKAYAAETKVIDEAARTIDFVISTATVDRVGDTVAVDGWRLDNYRRNPVVLWCHDSCSPPIARATKVAVGVGALVSTAEFVPADVPEVGAFAECVFQLYRRGFMAAVSVGFLPIDYEWSNEDDRPWGIDFTAQELLEYSCCPVPANPEALIQARAAGVNTAPIVDWAERILDSGGHLILPRRLIEEARKAASSRAVGKAGRVLSGANEERLRSAHTEIGAVLAQLEPEQDPEAAGDEGKTTPAVEPGTESVAPAPSAEPPAEAVASATPPLTSKTPLRRLAAEIDLIKLRAA